MKSETAAGVAIHYAATREELFEVARLLLLVATWAHATGDARLSDRCVERSAEVLGATAADLRRII